MSSAGADRAAHSVLALTPDQVIEARRLLGWRQLELGAAVPDGSPAPLAVALGDLDGDLDALIGNQGQENQLLVNQGGLQGGNEGDFLLGAAVPSGSQDTLALALGDLDGDGAGGVTASGLPWLGSKLPTVADVDWAA